MVTCKRNNPAVANESYLERPVVGMGVIPKEGRTSRVAWPHSLPELQGLVTMTVAMMMMVQSDQNVEELWHLTLEREWHLVWVVSSRHDHLHSKLVRLQLPCPPANISKRLDSKTWWYIHPLDTWVLLLWTGVVERCPKWPFSRSEYCPKTRRHYRQLL